jgi:hypothetical protein
MKIEIAEKRVAQIHSKECVRMRMTEERLDKKVRRILAISLTFDGWTNRDGCREMDPYLVRK